MLLTTSFSTSFQSLLLALCDMFKREVTKFSLIYSGKIKYKKLTIAICCPLNSLVLSCYLLRYHFLFLIGQLTAHSQVPSINVAMSEKLWVTTNQFGQVNQDHGKSQFQFYIWTDSQTQSAQASLQKPDATFIAVSSWTQCFCPVQKALQKRTVDS